MYRYSFRKRNRKALTKYIVLSNILGDFMAVNITVYRSGFLSILPIFRKMARAKES